MAWNSEGYELIFTLVDAGLNRSTKRFHMQAIDEAGAITAAATVLAALEAVCAAGTLSYSINHKYSNDAFALPAAGVQIEANALLVCEDDAVSYKRHTLAIPAPETDVFVDTTGENSNIVDIAHQDVLDYVNLFNDPGELTISDGEYTAADGIISGKRITRKSRKG